MSRHRKSQPNYMRHKIFKKIKHIYIYIYLVISIAIFDDLKRINIENVVA